MKLLVAGVGIVGSFVMLWQMTPVPLDLAPDWAAAQAISDGISPYQPSENFAPEYGIGGTEQTYPRTPGALLLGMPLALLPYAGLRVAGYLFVIASLAATAVLLGRLFDLDWWLLVGIMPMFLLTVPGLAIGFMANPAVLIAPLILLSLLMGEGDGYAAGVPVGLATVLKLWPWAIAAVLFFSGRRRMGIGAAASFGFLNLAGILLPGVSASGAIEAMTEASGRVAYGDNGGLTYLTGSTLSAQLILLVIVWWLARFEWRTGAIAMIPFALFLAPLLWPFYLIPDVIALIWAWRKGSVLPLIALPVSLMWIVIPAGVLTMALSIIAIASVVHALYWQRQTPDKAIGLAV